ncbi:MAG: ATP-binding protein [Proteobacteria bacterium]|nr:ATP-binding protein [Pseudomonadota bacterium]
MPTDIFKNNLKQFVVSLLGRWLYRGWQNGWIRFDNDLAASWPEELSMRFRELSQSMVMQSEALQNQVIDWQGPNFTRFWSQIIELSVQNDILANRWAALDEMLLLAPEEISLLALLSLTYQDWPLLRALRFAMSEKEPNQPRWGFVTHFLSDTADTSMTEQVLSPDQSMLFKAGIIQYNPYGSLAAAELTIIPDAVRYLLDSNYSDNAHLPAVPYKTLADPLRKIIKKIPEKPAPDHIIVMGATGSGKIYISQCIASRLRFNGIRTLDLMPETTIDRAALAIRQAIAMAVLRHDILVLKNVTKWADRWGDGIYQLLQLFENTNCPVIWTVTADVPSFLHVQPENIIRIPLPNRRQREELWKNLVGDTLSENWISQLAGQFLLTHGQMDSVYKAALVQPHEDEEKLYINISSQARAISQEGLGSLATPEPARVTMDQLIVSPECETALQDLLMYARHRRDLAKNWGFERSMPYGLGLAALFCGPPGTGKTYGAQVIATELQLELYRVDLSQLVSKYIGETEKHLAELFNAAEQGEILLLFDEADSVFSKRTEVKSSVDRYANLEVNYLLQRLERFSGVSVLTSNFESGIDEAFMRRIRFRVPFDLPDEKSRLILWNKFLSKSIPRADDVDLEFLADTFELSGGHIKEAVLRAASIAYGSPEKCVTQDLLLRSAELEYRKLGKLVPTYTPQDPNDVDWHS